LSLDYSIESRDWGNTDVNVNVTDPDGFNGVRHDNKYTALNFDGVDDYVEMSTIRPQTGALTISAWVKLKSYSTNGVSFIGGEGNTSSLGYWLGIRSSGEPTFALESQLNASSKISLNEPVYITGVWDGLEQRIYINGVLSNSISTTISVIDYTDIAPFRLAKITSLNTNRLWSGKIGRFELWGNALTETEINKYMRKAPFGTESGLISFWDINNNSGTTVFDMAGTNDGTIYGATWTDTNFLEGQFNNAKVIDNNLELIRFNNYASYNIDKDIVDLYSGTRYPPATDNYTYRDDGRIYSSLYVPRGTENIIATKATTALWGAGGFEGGDCEVITDTSCPVGDGKVIKLDATTNTSFEDLGSVTFTDTELNTGDIYTLSWWFKGNSQPAYADRIYYTDGTWSRATKTWKSQPSPDPNNWQYYEVEMLIQDNGGKTYSSWKVPRFFYGSTDDTSIGYFSPFQLEKKSYATDFINGTRTGAGLSYTPSSFGVDFNSKNWTVMAWVKYGETITAGTRSTAFELGSYYIAGETDIGVGTRTSTNRLNLYGYENKAGQFGGGINLTPSEAKDWILVALTCNSSKLTLHTVSNESGYQSVTDDANWDTSANPIRDNLFVGRYGWNNGEINGNIEDLVVVPYEITGSQIEKIGLQAENAAGISSGSYISKQIDLSNMNSVSNSNISWGYGFNNSYYIVGTGMEDNNSAHSILINGAEKSLDSRGLNLVRLDSNGDYIESKSYDTHGSSAESDACATYINGLPNTDYLIVASQDQAAGAASGASSGNLTQSCIDAIANRLSSTSISTLEYRSNWLIFSKIDGEKIVEKYRSRQTGNVKWAHDISVETSADNQATWQSVSNGGQIQSSMNSADSLYIKATLKTEDGTVSTFLDSLTVEIETPIQYKWDSNTTTPSLWDEITANPVTQSSDGIWYLHTKYFENNEPVTEYKGTFNIDKTPPVSPNVTLVNNTSHSLSLSWTAEDSLSGLDYVRLYVQKSDSGNAHVADIDIDGNGTTEYSLPIGTQTSYTVDGLEEYQHYRYYIRVYDKAGNIANDGYHLMITDDITEPVVGYNLNSRDWLNTNVDEVINVDDQAGSGVAEAWYKWTNSAVQPTDGWIVMGTTTNFNTSQSQEGEWYLHIKATDNYSNTAYDYSGPYKIDKTAPVINSTNITLDSPTNVYDTYTATIEWDVEDAYSGVNKTELGFYKGSNGLEFDGVNDYVDCGNSTELDITESITLECWVKGNHLGSWDRILAKGYDNSWFLGTFDTNGTARFRLDSNSSMIAQLESNTIIQDGKWHHISGTYDGAQLKLYIDGILENQTSGTGLINIVTSNLYIGDVDFTSSFAYSGVVKDARIWNTARTADQIKDNMYTKLTGNETGLVAYYPMDEDTGTTLIDKAGSNNGTINGATWDEGGWYYDENTLPDGITTNVDMDNITGGGVKSATFNNIPREVEIGAEFNVIDNATNNIKKRSDNNCLSFDGVDDYVKINNVGFNSEQITIEFWAKINTSSGKNYAFDTGDERDPLMKWDDGDTSVIIWGLGSTGYTNYSQGYKIGEFAHYALTYDNSTERLYINGDEVDSKTGSEIVNFDDLWIGNYNNLGYSIDGLIYDFQIWNKALTQTEIQNYMHNKPDPNDPNLVAYYPFSEGSGNTLYDVTPNSNHGTINGATWEKEYDYALSFDGNEYITIPDVAEEIHGGTEATIEFWCRADELYSTGSGIVQLSGFESTNGNLYPYNSFTKVYLDVFRTDRIGPIYTNSPVNELHHFAITTTPGTDGWRFYQNGELIHSATGPGSVSANYNDFTLGFNSGNRYLHGIMNDVRIWNTARTQTEIQENMHKELTGDESGLVAYYKMNEFSGNTLIDHAGDNDGRIEGAHWVDKEGNEIYTPRIINVRTVTTNSDYEMGINSDYKSQTEYETGINKDYQSPSSQIIDVLSKSYDSPTLYEIGKRTNYKSQTLYEAGINKTEGPAPSLQDILVLYDEPILVSGKFSQGIRLGLSDLEIDISDFTEWTMHVFRRGIDDSEFRTIFINSNGEVYVDNEINNEYDVSWFESTNEKITIKSGAIDIDELLVFPQIIDQKQIGRMGGSPFYDPNRSVKIDMPDSVDMEVMQ